MAMEKRERAIAMRQAALLSDEELARRLIGLAEDLEAEAAALEMGLPDGA
jgi:hypothetical protein